MVDDTIKTGVDDLLELLKKYDKIPLQDAAAKLNIPTKILQTWVDFLVEERVISVEYKFTQPYIYINRVEEEKKQEKPLLSSLKEIKNDFFERAKKKNFTDEQIELLWQRKLNIELGRHKDYFIRYAETKRLKNIDLLWKEFSEKIKGEI